MLSPSLKVLVLELWNCEVELTSASQMVARVHPDLVLKNGKLEIYANIWNYMELHGNIWK